MARPLKQGVNYFPSDVDTFNDFKIMDLVDRFGPIGYLVYDWTIRKIYSNGYFLEIDLVRLSLYFIKDIGNKWVKNKQLVVQVIHYCADIGLFDNDLLTQNVITSAGIQRRYLEITARRQALYCKKYWLLNKDVLSAPINSENVDNNSINVDNNSINADNNTPKKIKQNKTKVNKDLCDLFDVAKAFDLFWLSYPKKVDKKKASQKFIKICNDDKKYQSIMTGLTKYKSTKQWQNIQFVPNPTTWLNGERWNDEVVDLLINANTGDSQKQLPAWYANQDSVQVDTDNFDEAKLEEKLKKLRGE